MTGLNILIEYFDIDQHEVENFFKSSFSFVVFGFFVLVQKESQITCPIKLWFVVVNRWFMLKK